MDAAIAKPPRLKRPINASLSFFGRRISQRHGKGMMKMTKSKTTLINWNEYKNAVVEMQVPGMVGSKALLVGLHWKMPASTVAAPHAQSRERVIVVAVFIVGVGKSLR